MARPSVIRVLTWNVHGCVGRDGERDPARVAAVIAALEPDLVGLQEVDCRGAGAAGDQLEQLARGTGLAMVPGPARHEAGGYFGNALLTRFPITTVAHTDVSVAGREPRALLDVTVTASAATEVRAVVTHFGLRRLERRRQAEALLQLAHGGGGPPTVVMGDFNEWWPRARTLMKLNAAFGRSPAAASFPARWPLFALDRIWTAPREVLIELRAVRVPAARAASDHLPVLAIIDLARSGAAVQSLHAP